MRGAAGVAPLRIVVLFVAALGNFRKGFGMVGTVFPVADLHVRFGFVFDIP